MDDWLVLLPATTNIVRVQRARMSSYSYAAVERETGLANPFTVAREWVICRMTQQSIQEPESPRAILSEILA